MCNYREHEKHLLRALACHPQPHQFICRIAVKIPHPKEKQKRTACVEEQNLPPQNMSLWHKDYFWLMTFKKLPTHDKLCTPKEGTLLQETSTCLKESSICRGVSLAVSGREGRIQPLETPSSGEDEDLSLRNNLALVYCAPITDSVSPTSFVFRWRCYLSDGSGHFGELFTFSTSFSTIHNTTLWVVFFC